MKMKRSLVLLMLAMVPWQLAACRAQNGVVDGAGVPMAKCVSISAEQAGQSVPVHVGDEVCIALMAQMGTGFSWQLITPDSKVAATSGNTELKPTTPGLPGGPEQQIFHLKVLAAGAQTLQFEYRQPWVKDGPAGKTFTVTLNAS